MLYYLIYDYKKKFFINKLLNKKITIKFNYTFCINCKYIKIIFKNGYCKVCFYKNFYIGIYHPSKCTSHLNIENKNIIIEKKIELQDHITYISYTSNFKVGISTKKNIFNRLMDQGSTVAIILAITPNRYLSGIIEKISKKLISDRSYYKNILNYSYINNKKIIKIKNKIYKYIDNYYKNYIIFLKKKNIIYRFTYPILKKIKKVILIKLNINKKINSKLIGIKGQYLIFNNNNILNINSHIGYSINIKIY